MLERLQLAGRAGAGGEPVLVLLLAGPDLLDVLLQPGDVPVEVVDGDLGADPLVLQRGELPGQRLQLGPLGQGAAAVRELGEGGVDRLKVEQAALSLRVSLHGRAPCRLGRCGCGGVHGPRIGVQVGHDRLDARASRR